MSESRNNSESRGSRYTPSYVSRPSESRDTGESRCSYSSNNFSSESRNDSESRYDSRGQVNNSRYNNLDDIDSLIEKLEREMHTITSNPSSFPNWLLFSVYHVEYSRCIASLSFPYL